MSVGAAGSGPDRVADAVRLTEPAPAAPVETQEPVSTEPPTERPDLGLGGRLAARGLQDKVTGDYEAKSLGDKKTKGASRGVKTGEKINKETADLATRRKRAVDEIGRGGISDERAFPNFEKTLQDIYKKEGSAGVESFRKDVEANLKKNFGDRASVKFDEQLTTNGDIFLEIEITQVAKKGHTVRHTGGVPLGPEKE